LKINSYQICRKASRCARVRIVILNNVRQHSCFIIKGSYIGYMFRHIDQSSSGLFSWLSHKVLCTHWDPSVYTAPCDSTS